MHGISQYTPMDIWNGSPINTETKIKQEIIFERMITF